jgi:hypothetical protein
MPPVRRHIVPPAWQLAGWIAGTFGCPLPLHATEVAWLRERVTALAEQATATAQRAEMA